MVTSISSNSNSVSNWADSIFSKLDTKNQGYIDKTDLQDALSKVSGDGKGGGRSVNVNDTFSALDGDQDGKITKSELTDAMTKLSDQLNAQFDAARVGRGGGGGGQAPAGPPPGGQGGSTGATDASSSSSSSSSDYIAAADTDGNGTVSEAEKAAYEKKLANAQADGGSSAGDSSASDGTRYARHQKDPVRELAHAMHLLKAYAENSGGNGSTASTGSTDGTSDSGSGSGNLSVSVSVEA